MPEHYHGVAARCGGWHIAMMQPWSPARIAWAIVVAAAASIGSVGCNSEPAGGSVDGPAVFGIMCASCHGPDGHPPAAMAARLGVRDLAAPEFRAKATPVLVEHQVRHGSANKLMPAFEGAISDAQIRAVSAWVASPKFGAPPQLAAPK